MSADLTKIDEAAAVVRDALDELVKGLRDTIATLQAQNDALKDKVEELEQDARHAADADEWADQEHALEVVRYWLLDVLVHGKPPTDPRRVMRVVEEALR